MVLYSHPTMSPHRSQSLPPKFDIRHRTPVVRDDCISKATMRFTRKNRARTKNRFRFKLPIDPTTGIDIHLPLRARLEPEPDGLWLSVCNSTTATSISPSLERWTTAEPYCDSIERGIPEGFVGCDVENNPRVSSDSTEGSVGRRTNNAIFNPTMPDECSLSYHHCYLSTTKSPRYDILSRELQGRVHNGKPFSIARLLAGYGRNDYAACGESNGDGRVTV